MVMTRHGVCRSRDWHFRVRTLIPIFNPERTKKVPTLYQFNIKHTQPTISFSGINEQQLGNKSHRENTSCAVNYANC
jgi:hypothetical protein